MSASTDGLFTNFELFPEAASTVSHQVDAIFLAWVGISAVVMIGIFGALLFFMYRYRRGSSAPRRSNPNISTFKLEITWTLIPLVISLAMGLWAARVYLDMHLAPPGSTEIYVVGKQWMWKAQHLEGQMEINELHVPIHRPIKLLMTSQDVIHSFFVPAFRIKQDVLPGRYTSVWFEADKTGEFELYCSQYCGSYHSRMIGRIVVMEEADYEKWLGGQPFPQRATGVATASAATSPDGASAATESAPSGKAVVSLTSAGRTLFQNKACISCHSGAPNAIGPNLAGIYGHEETLQGGEKVRVDENYIRESIINPNAKIVQGYQPVMPSFEGQLTEEELAQLVEYVKSLGAAAPPRNNP